MSPTLSTTKVSLPSPPVMLSAPTPPLRVSLPSPPLIVSSPPRPDSELFPSLPVMTLASSLPVPFTSAAPVSVRFSKLAPSVRVAEDSTWSVPAPAASVSVSAALSTT